MCVVLIQKRAILQKCALNGPRNLPIKDKGFTYIQHNKRP